MAQSHPESVGIESEGVAAANFAREYKLLLKRKGNIVYRECSFSEYRGFGVYSTNKAGSR